MRPEVDLRSDTLTLPTSAMRAALANAHVGDDVFGEDPTVRALESLAAERLGKETGLFLPTGTMANLVAFLSQSNPGDSVILSGESHPYRYEGANFARFGGLLPRTPASIYGKIDVSGIAAHLMQIDDPHFSPTTLVSIENTTNLGGGAYYTVAEVEGIGALCRDTGLRLHCDGARLFNAAVAQKVDVGSLAAPCDSVSFCLSKGLGAPVGSLLVSDGETIHRARRIRKQLGGGMRQAGILAAAGIYALNHHVNDLAEDHRRARSFREHLEGVGIPFPCPTPTNIVLISSPDPTTHVAALAQMGVKVLAVGPSVIRAVFHRDIDDTALNHAIESFTAVMAP